MQGSSVLGLQRDLKNLGFLQADLTGYYGDLTTSAVKKLQKKYGYAQDGVAGADTLALVDKLASGGSVSTKSSTPAVSSRTSVVKTAASDDNFLLPWSSASKVFARGTTATVYDIETGISFKIKRTYGTNHADCETLTAADTKTMKKIFGGSWSWNRRAVILTVGDTKIAASIAGMPHAGDDDKTANRTISSRSGGFGRGMNYDSVKSNGMDGHFDVHFLGSKTHGTNRLDPAHQSMVKKAAAWAKENL
jgi:peptidoglycan hydrolase-like protein with peptidoglycan-binding domain